jgi:transposase
MINHNPDQADQNAQQLIRHTKQIPRRRFTPEEKVRILIEGIRGEIPVSVLCRREGIGTNVYYKWLKDFMEASKGRLKGDSLREANRAEVETLKQENQRLKELVAQLSLENLVLKKAWVSAHGSALCP